LLGENRNRIAALLTGGAGVLLAARALARRRTAMDFAGRVVVITGGSRGLGLVMARLFAGEGAKVALLARDEAQLARGANDVRAHAPQADVLTVACDLTQKSEVEAAIARVAAHFGQIDVLVNNAGMIAVGPFDHQTDDDFQTMLAIHLWATLWTTRAALPHLRRAAAGPNGAARIVNITSFGGRVGVPHMAAYCASKHAQVGLSDTIRAELARDNIAVTTVSPGVLRTGSHVNATFKGQHEKEFAWFTLGAANPLLSTDALSAARQIVGATRHGDPSLIITLPGQSHDGAQWRRARSSSPR
jgi:NAD(P)-dependent dehydrogenase (short-subunit alcohol dehydrogenase family)